MSKARRILPLTPGSWKTITMHARNGRAAMIASRVSDGSNPFEATPRRDGCSLSNLFIAQYLAPERPDPLRRALRGEDYHGPHRRARSIKAPLPSSDGLS